MIRIVVQSDVADQIRCAEGQIELVDEQGNHSLALTVGLPFPLPNAYSGDDVMARPANKFAVIRDDKSRDELVTLWKSHPHHYTRVRAHAVLLSG